MIKKRTIKFELFAIIFIDTILWAFAASLLFDVFYDKFGEARISNSLAVNTAYYVVTLLFLFIFNIPLILYLLKKVDKPVQKIISGLQQVTAGNYSIHLQAGSDNEFGKMCDAFNYMTEQLLHADEIQKNTENERILLFANMAHDLKTPITTILGFSKAMAGGMVTDAQKQQAYMQTIAVKAGKMNDLIDRLFEYVKLESVDNVLHRENTSLSELLRECVGAVFSEFENRKMNVTIEIPGKDIVQSVDSLEISRVFTNLLENVIKHNPSGTKILIKLDSPGTVTVADTGNSIPGDVAQRLFTPFTSGDNSRMSCNGSGLGLALSYKIMKRHGGTLLYTSPYPGYTKAFSAVFSQT
jgi:signal transduction histidine kinase